MKLRNIITGRGKGVSLKIKHSNSIQKKKKTKVAAYHYIIHTDYI